MAFYSLPLEKNNVKVPEEYCYLVIVKYQEDNFKPSKGKKLSAEESKNKKEKFLSQQETIKQLDTGYCNLHNRKIELSTIFDSFFVGYLDKYDNHLIYKIKPLASNEISKSYDSQKRFEVSEFDVVKKFKDKSEIIQQIHKDKLLPEFSAIMFDKLSYTNAEHREKLFAYFQYINNVFKDLEISLADILLSNDYNMAFRGKFKKNDTGESTKENIRYLLDNKYIKYFKEGDYYQVKLIVGLVDCGLFDVALECIKLLDERDVEELKKNKDFDIALKKWSMDEAVKEIINVLGIKLSGMTLTVKEYMDYGEDRIIETEIFDNIGDIKTHLIKKYDVPFERVMSKDIDGLEWDGFEFRVS